MPKWCHREVESLLTRMKNRYGAELQRDPAGVRDALVRALKDGIPVPKGRPRDEAITKAEEMRQEGRGAAEIAAFLYPDAWSGADKYHRRYLVSQARAALRQRQRREQQRSNGSSRIEEGQQAQAGDGCRDDEGERGSVYAVCIQEGGQGAGDRGGIPGELRQAEGHHDHSRQDGMEGAARPGDEARSADAETEGKKARDFEPSA